VTRGGRSARRGAGATGAGRAPGRERSHIARWWYRSVQLAMASLFAAFGGLRATGRRHVPASGGALLVANHLSYLDVIVLGILLPRPLNYVARSTLFFPPLGALIRSIGAFPIQREGMGASGLKETLRRLRDGGVVVLFPEGTRSPDGELGALKPGIAALASRARVPIIPAAVAGTFEAWPRDRLVPRPHAIRVHYGPPILPEEWEDRSPEALVALIRSRLAASLHEARGGIARDLQGPAPAVTAP
jgi:1-acyl-sn-glycerol-3-phosphate acyltransferase